MAVNRLTKDWDFWTINLLLDGLSLHDLWTYAQALDMVDEDREFVIRLPVYNSEVFAELIHGYK